MSDLSEKPITSPTRSSTDQELLALIARAKNDPIVAEKLASLGQQSIDALLKIVHEVTGMLSKIQPRTDNPASQSNSVAALASAARARAMAGKEKRELAEDLVIGALINHGNPDWNPLDPASSWEASNNALLALLQNSGGGNATKD
jgi:hypothetical protein